MAMYSDDRVWVGFRLGRFDGLEEVLGINEGLDEGLDGLDDGDFDGLLLGDAVDGLLLGDAVDGILLGDAVDGLLLGDAVDGLLVGPLVGTDDMEGEYDGIKLMDGAEEGASLPICIPSKPFTHSLKSKKSLTNPSPAMIELIDSLINGICVVNGSNVSMNVVASLNLLTADLIKSILTKASFLKVGVNVEVSSKSGSV
jgi:hypothetical protein